jgi:DNA-binding CsgD family transcriptional regulator/PAS domain-containing protein
MNACTHRETTQAIAALYEAAIDDAGWNAALARVAQLAEAVTAIFFLHDAATNRLIDSRVAGGFTPHWLKCYADHYMLLDPARQVLERLPSSTMRPMHRYISPAVFGRSEYYQDFYVPSGLRFSCGGRSEVVDGQHAIIAVHRPPDHNPFSDQTVDHLQQVLDHLPGILRVRTLSRRDATQGALSTAALAALPRAVFVLDGCMRLHYANPAAEALVREGMSLTSHCGYLRVGDVALGQALARRVAAACRRPPTLDTAPLYAVDVGGRPRLELQLVPLPEGSNHVQRPQPLALLSVRPVFRLEPWDRGSPRPFKLTDAEFRLIVALVEGLTPEQYGHRQQISVNTVRTHIRAVLHKTGLRKASEVVALFSPLEVLGGKAGGTPPSHA